MRRVNDIDLISKAKHIAVTIIFLNKRLKEIEHYDKLNILYCIYSGSISITTQDDVFTS